MINFLNNMLVLIINIISDKLNLILLLILVIGFIIRIYNVSYNPVGFFADEAAISYGAYTILKDGTDEYGRNFPILFKALDKYILPFEFYYIVPFVWLFGLTEFTIRLGAVCIGTATIVLLFFVTKHLFQNKLVGIFCVFCLSIMPWHIHYSRIGLIDIIATVFLVLAFYYCFILWSKYKTKYFIYGLGVLSLINILNYRAQWIIVPILFIVIIILYWKDIRKQYKHFFIAFIPFILVCLYLLLHFIDIRHDRALEVWAGKDLNSIDTIFKIFRNYFSHFSFSFLFSDGDNNWNMRHYLRGFGMMPVIYLPFIVLGFIRLLFNIKSEVIIFLVLILIYPIAGSLSEESPISNRNIIGTVVFAVLAGYGIYTGFVLLKYIKFNIIYKYCICLFLILIISFNTGNYLYEYHTNYPIISADYWGWQMGAREIIEYFEVVHDDYDQLIMTHEFNAAAIFIKFYSPNNCYNCIIGNINLYNNNMKQLFAERVELFESYRHRIDYDIKNIISYPDGSKAFIIFEINSM